MGILSWLFPTDDDRLRRARAHMGAGRYADARKILLHCHAPEAEALYDKCSAAVELGDRAQLKKRLAGDGFHGWKIQVDLSSARRKAELEKLIGEELARSGVDLGLPDIDEKVFQAAVARAQRRTRGAGGRETGAVKLVPIVDARR
jgi:hypothetical protein